MDLVSLCEGHIHGSSSCAAKVIASSILSSETDILELIQALGVYLTSTNVDTRSSAMDLLSSVLQLLGTKQSLLSNDVAYLVQFYCDRLKDHAVILPRVLAGLHILTTEQGIKQDDALLIFRSIFKEVYCQTLQFEERHKLFTMFLSLLTHHLPALIECSDEFVLSYIQLLDGERDPRNLLVAFSSVRIILQNLHFDSLVDDLFDVISCYFPIDFTAPPNDPTAISRGALVESLGQCLAATPKFAGMCLPLLLEKLSSDILSAKVDSLRIVEMAAPVYGAKALEPCLEALWNAIKKEMFRSANQDLQLACVAALRALSHSLSQPLHDSYLQTFIDMALQDCGRHLSEPELKLMEPVVQLLCGIIMGSDPAAAYLIPKVMPILLRQYPALPHGSHKQRLVLDAIRSFVKAAVALAKDVKAASPLSVCKEEILDVLQSALSQTQLVCKEIACTVYSDLLSARNLLHNSEVIDFCQFLKTMALSSEEETRQVLRSPLQSMCKTFPSLAQEHLISPVLMELNTNPDSAWLLAVVAISPTMTASILPSLLSVLQELVMTSHKDQYWESIFSIASALLMLVEQNAKSVPLDPNLRDSLVQLSQQAANTHWQCCVAEVSRLVELLSVALSQNARYASDSWCDGAMGVVVKAVMADTCTLPSALPTGLCVMPLTALLAASPCAVVSRWSDQLCGPLLKVSVGGGPCFKYTVQAYASILNKHPEGDVLCGWVSSHMTCLWNAICPSNQPTDDSSSESLVVWIWMTKALVMRTHELGLSAAQRLLELCARNDKVGAAAADGFKLILSDTKDVLSRECHANVKLFFKQQLFVSILPELIRMMKVKECKKQCILRALSHFLTGVPQQVILGEFHKVLPLLMESLTNSDPDVKISSLNGVLSILIDTPESFSTHITALLPCLLSLISDKSSMMIRRTALQCIEMLCSLPTHLIYPYQRQVIQALAPCLDDHKRLVRRAAVNARSKWFLL